MFLLSDFQLISVYDTTKIILKTERLFKVKAHQCIYYTTMTEMFQKSVNFADCFKIPCFSEYCQLKNMQDLRSKFDFSTK